MGSKTLLGFIAGVSAGAILGILFAPDKGSATREKITKKSTDFSDSIKESFGDFIDNIKSTVNKTKDHAEEWADTAKKNFKTKMNEAGNTSAETFS